MGAAAGANLRFSLRFNRGLFDEHDRDIVLDPVDAVAAQALQRLLVFGQLDVGLALGAGHNREKLRIKGHSNLLSRFAPYLIAYPPRPSNGLAEDPKMPRLKRPLFRHVTNPPPD